MLDQIFNIYLLVVQQEYKETMIANYERVLMMLRNYENPEKIKQVQRQLEALEDDPTFIQLLHIAIKDDKEKSNVRLAAAVTMNRLINDKIQEMPELKVLASLLNMIMNMQVEIKYKKANENALTYLFQMIDQGTIKQLIYPLQKIIINIQERMKGQNIPLRYQKITLSCVNESQMFGIIQVVIFIFKCLVNSNTHMSIFNQVLCDTIFKLTEILPFKANKDNIQILQEFTSFIYDLLAKIKSIRSVEYQDCYDQLINRQHLHFWIYSVYMIGCINNQPHFLPHKHDHLDHEEFSNLKKSVTLLHKELLKRLDLDKNMSVIQQHLLMSTQLFNTITIYTAHRDFLSSYQEFITGLIGIFTLLVKLNCQYFAPSAINIVHMIIFPLLAITEEEKMTFENEPQEFKYLAEDCCDHQKFGILKTQVSALLETLCDESPQTASYVVQHAILSIKLKISNPQNIQNTAITFLPIQQAFLALSILSYKLLKYPNELLQLKLAIQPNNIIGKFDPLETSRIYTFLAFNYEEMYKIPTEGQFWINKALNQESHRTTGLIALDFITNVVEEYFTEPFLLQFAKTLPVAHKFDTIRLQTLIKIINVHLLKISQESITFVIDILFQTAKMQIQRYNKKDKEHTMDIVKCIQLTKKILDKKQYSQGKVMMKMKIWQFLTLMEGLNRVSLDEQIIKLIVSFINLDGVCQNAYSTLEIVLKYFRQGNQSSTSYLLYYNAFVMHGSHEILPIILQILSSALLHLNELVNIDQKNIKDKIGIATILLILQNIMALHGDKIDINTNAKIIQLIMRFIPIDDSPEIKIEPVLLARSLILLFLCNMYVKSDFALRKLLMFQDFPIFKSYDLKVLLKCLTKEMLRQNDMVSIAEMINISVRCISQTKEQQTIMIKSKKNPFAIKSSCTKIKIRRIEDYQKFLKFAKTPFSIDTIPEFELKVTLETMKNNNQQLYETILKSLTQEIRSKLKNLMSEVTIDGKKRQIVHTGSVKANQNMNMSMSMNSNRKNGVLNYKRKLQDQEIEISDFDEAFSKKMHLKTKRMKNQAISQRLQ